MILAGIIALLVAMAAGVAVVQQALAHNTDYSVTATCTTWSATGNYVNGGGTDASHRRLVLMRNVKINGVAYDPSWSTVAGQTGGSNNLIDSNGIKTYAGYAATLPGAPSTIPGIAAPGAGESFYVWVGRLSSWNILTRNQTTGLLNLTAGAWGGSLDLYEWSGTSTGGQWVKNNGFSRNVTAPSAPTNCDRTIRVHKVVEGVGAPAKTFSYTISPAGVSDTVAPGASDDHTVLKNVAQTLVETEALSDGWSFVKYTRKASLDSDCTGENWSDQGTNQANGVSIPADSNNYTICIYNRYDQPQVILPEVKKVAVDPPNNLSGGYAFWDIVITPAGASSPAFDNLQVVDFYNIAIHSQNPANACTVLGDGKTLECDVPAGASPVTVRVKRAVAEAVQNQCLGGEISNKLVSASYNQQPITITQGTSPITYTIPGIPSACDKPGITKTTQTTSTTNPNDVSWTVQVTNPASGTGTQQTVWIKDSNVVVVSGPTLTGGANCDPNSTTPNFQTQLNDSDGVQCSMPNNSTITFQVKPAGTIARTCADQKFNNTAEIYVGSTTAPPVSAVGPEITLTGNPALCDREVKVCKLLVGNNDGIVRTGDFWFEVSAGEVMYTFAIPVTEFNPTSAGALPNPFPGTFPNDAIKCATVTVPAGVTAYVKELSDRPAGWNGDHPTVDGRTYPSYYNGVGGVGGWHYGQDLVASIAPEANNQWVIFKNREKPTRELEICKVVAGNGDGTVDGGVFKFNITGIAPVELIAYEPAGDQTDGIQGDPACIKVRVANTTVTVTEWEARPPTYGWEGSWNGDDPLFPQNSVFGLGLKNGTANVPANVNKVTFYNKTNPRDREIIIEKFFLNLGNYQLAPGDWPNFVPNPPIEGWTFAANCTELLNGIDPNHRAWSCKVPASWPGDIEEELDEDRWEQVACDFPEAQRIAEVFTFCNTPVTRVTVIKQFVGDFNGETFTFSNTNLPGPVANAPGGNSNQVQVFDSLVEPDSFSVTENEFLTQSEGCFGDEAEGYHTVYSIVKNGVTIATQVEGDTANFTAGPGDEVIVTFINARCGILSSPQIVIQKFNDPAGNRTGTNGLAGFQFRVFNNGVELPGSPFVLGAGPLLIPGLNPGTVEVLELDPNTGGWVLTGSKTDLGDNGSFEFEVGGQPAARNIDFGEIIRFNFYNQPRVNITVNKVIFNNANPQGANGGAGWTFTLSGCGVGPDQQTTGASGSVSWTNLPPAVNCTYTVTETAKAGWVADQISYNTSPTAAGSTANLTFVNRQIEGCVNINDCPPGTTPTPTPTTPPGSTPTPTSTPTTPPGETPAASPTPEETVAGEQTPGPGQPTPIAPSTGAGFGIGGAAGFNLLLVIAGLLAISGGFSFIALGRRSANRR